MAGILTRLILLPALLANCAASADAAIIGQSFADGRKAIIGALAMHDLHHPSLGYCHVDLVEKRGIFTGNCREVARDIRGLAEAFGVALPEGDAFHAALPDMVHDSWALVERRNAEGR